MKPFLTILFLSGIIILCCVCTKQNDNAFRERDHLYTMLPSENSPECIEFYRNKHTTDKEAQEHYEMIISMSTMLGIEKYISKKKCPRKNILLIAECRHNGKTYRQVVRRTFGSSDMIIYYYSSGRFSTATEAIDHTKAIEENGYSIQYRHQ